MTIIDASTPCEALIFPFIVSARHACIAFYIFPLSRHFLSKVCFSSRKRVFLSFIQSCYFYWRPSVLETHFIYWSCWDLYKLNSLRTMVNSLQDTNSLHSLTWWWPLKWPFITTFFGHLLWMMSCVPNLVIWSKNCKLRPKNIRTVNHNFKTWQITDCNKQFLIHNFDKILL